VSGELRRVRAPVLLSALGALLVGAVFASVGIGAVAISPVRTLGILAGHAGLDLGIPYGADEDAVLWSIRLPRVVLGLLVGSALGVSGAALQAVFRNPLADPGLIGVASGASVGAVGAIVLGVAGTGAAALPAAAFAGGLAATVLVYGLARHEGRTEVITLLLTGLAVNAIAGAAIGFMLFLADDEQLRGAVFWTLGSLGGATWPAVGSAAAFVLVALPVLLALGRPLNLLLLGEREAAHLGVATEPTRLAVVAAAALATAAAVAFAGVIGFVGLIVPHLVRLVAGPDNRVVLPASALAGAALLLYADLAARTIAAPAELPLGVLTALLGGPFFLWLVQRTRREQGGWG
jgi:iron complex transport system permease protein